MKLLCHKVELKHSKVDQDPSFSEGLSMFPFLSMKTHSVRSLKLPC